MHVTLPDTSEHSLRRTLQVSRLSTCVNSVWANNMLGNLQPVPVSQDPGTAFHLIMWPFVCPGISFQQTNWSIDKKCPENISVHMRLIWKSIANTELTWHLRAAGKAAHLHVIIRFVQSNVPLKWCYLSQIAKNWKMKHSWMLINAGLFDDSSKFQTEEMLSIHFLMQTAIICHEMSHINLYFPSTDLNEKCKGTTAQRQWKCKNDEKLKR